MCPPYIEEQVLLNKSGLLTLGETLWQCVHEHAGAEEDGDDLAAAGAAQATEDAADQGEDVPVATWVSCVEEVVGMQDASGVAGVWATIGAKF